MPNEVTQPSERAKAAAHSIVHGDFWGTPRVAAAIDAHFPHYDQLKAVYDAAVVWEEQYEKSKRSAQHGSIDEGIAESKKLKDARDLFWAAVQAVKEQSNG